MALSRRLLARAASVSTSTAATRGVRARAFAASTPLQHGGGGCCQAKTPQHATPSIGCFPPASSQFEPAVPAAAACSSDSPSDSVQRCMNVGVAAAPVRNDWTKQEIQSIYDRPLLDLVFEAASVHRAYHNAKAVQKCQLLSIKTGGCSEDCAYCPQSSRYTTGVQAEKMMDVDYVLKVAQKAKDEGSTRFCMGAAWREVGGKKTAFNKVLQMVRGIRAKDLEVCCTLGMLSKEEAAALKDAGLTAYNHNLDTGEEYYKEIITTRSYDERLSTLSNVRDAGITVCCGGIIGMGEKHTDRVSLLHTLATLPKHPESVPVNALVPVEGTPLEKQPRVSAFELVRMIATARIVMPSSMVRLSAGRLFLSMPEQALCFLAGANSIFVGEKLLTTSNNAEDQDSEMFSLLGLEGLKPNLERTEKCATA